MRWYAMVCDASRSSKSQENGPFHRIVWQGLKADSIMYRAVSNNKDRPSNWHLRESDSGPLCQGPIYEPLIRALFPRGGYRILERGGGGSRNC